MERVAPEAKDDARVSNPTSSSSLQSTSVGSGQEVPAVGTWSGPKLEAGISCRDLTRVTVVVKPFTAAEAGPAGVKSSGPGPDAAKLECG